jgi:hypothetical protein
VEKGKFHQVLMKGRGTRQIEVQKTEPWQD